MDVDIHVSGLTRLIKRIFVRNDEITATIVVGGNHRDECECEDKSLM